jgi:hypothetical protein
MSDAPKKRPWFQFHLSTAVVMVFVAAGLLWLNTTSRCPDKKTYAAYGWPLGAYDRYGLLNMDGRYEKAEGWIISGLVVNVLVGLTAILVVGIVCEWQIRLGDFNQSTTDVPKKRPRFRFHFRTALVIIFVAAGLLWLNMHNRPSLDPMYLPGVDNDDC